ncbi:MAG: undecaprenyl/decaprenyl-phosphate alpha-N-acetylglucosaminyl 1-phosphate transferase [Alphaproteobacteria bacterium]|nr:undecaprenyl/decaprenyl-phosphate alpha-N-acetylglucosaminyl 1-phosphate transferase [Alphaproteobacteria bacterium]
MTLLAFLTHMSFGAVLCVLSAALTWVLMKRVRIIDTPNDRSSHSVPTPRSGGIAIVVAFFAGLAGLWVLRASAALEADYFQAFAASSLLIAAASIFDDLRGMGFKAKLILQTVCAVAVMALGVVVTSVHLPGVGAVELGWLGYPLTLIWIVGLTNAFNFMDGIDGIAGGTAVVAALFFAMVTFSLGSSFAYLVSIVIGWSALGFLMWNWQPAKIFMGDSGSQFLGFVFAVLAVVAGRFDASQVPFLVMPLLFFHYIWDTGYTFWRRWRAGERVTEAHRGHLYQLMNRLGASHARVTTLYLFLGAFQGVAALWLVQAPGHVRVLAFLPFAFFLAILTGVVTRRARRLGLIA